MPTTKNTKIALTLIIATFVIVAPLVLMSVMNQIPPPPLDEEDEDLEDLEIPVTSVNVTLLDFAGVMIEANNIRIYVDPYHIKGGNFSDYPADMILITHAHPDHYSKLSHA